MTLNDIARNKNLTADEIVAIAEELSGQKILWTIEDVMKKLQLGRPATTKLFAMEGFPYVKNGNVKLAIASEVNEFLKGIRGESIGEN